MHDTINSPLPGPGRSYP